MSHDEPDIIFWSYFDLADELWSSTMKLDDFDPAFVKEAQLASIEHDLPWPPYLPAAEEKLNDIRNRRS